MVNIYTFQFNDADFLHWQFLTFRKFLKDEHRLICINNSFDKPDEKEAIKRKAEELGIPHFFPQGVDHSKGGYSHQTALNWVWKNFIVDSNGINIIVDHDMFPIKEISCEMLLASNYYDITGIMQGRAGGIKYFHPGFMAINNTLKDKETVDFKGEYINGSACDTGGNWHHYLTAHPDLKIKGLSLVNICAEHENVNLLPKEAQEGYYEDDPMQICEDYIIHYRNGSRWFRYDENKSNRKKQQLFSTLNYYNGK